MTRRFDIQKAVAGGLPLSFGLCGPSGSGKTFSALRLATGMTRVCGGRIVFVDTEHGRARHYASDFDFDHLDFDPPHSPSAYSAALKAAVDAGATTIIIDSMSHEHEGAGGVLEMHEQECERLVKAWGSRRDAVQLTAWSKPKAERTRLLLEIARCPANVILCFRAKEKIRPATKEEKDAGQRAPIDLGWMPIAGSEFAYEMTAMGVLPPNSHGVPDWQGGGAGTQLIRKRPKMFADILANGRQLDEDMGEALARWSRGEKEEPVLSDLAEGFLVSIHASESKAELDQTMLDIRATSGLTPFDKRALRAACGAQLKALATEVA